MVWQSVLIPGTGPGKKTILSVIAKRTYTIARGSVMPAEEQPELAWNEIPANPDNPLYSELITDTEVIAYKPLTDVVILGKAHAPQGKKVRALQCEARVGPLSKAIMVFGERKILSKRFHGQFFSDPEYFTECDLNYSNAYGGMAKSPEGTLLPYPMNPLGRGFTLKGSFDDESEIVVPYCEDPAAPITPETMIIAKYEDWSNTPKPVSFGWTRQNFFPRYTYAGVLPEMLAGALKIQPETKTQMDLRFYQGASEGLIGGPLLGNEHVKLVAMDPEFPQFEFDLPGEKPQIILTLSTDQHELSPVLQTVMIDKQNNLLTMVWRGSQEYGGTKQLEEASGFKYEVQ